MNAEQAGSSVATLTAFGEETGRGRQIAFEESAEPRVQHGAAEPVPDARLAVS
ncbi:hypothetical protein [Nocardia jiangsuensis]|uniref:Uncharacterized protein n=1 Tax=Nocardia jiangsuensis TaxID=1691563 RepID=A0ABV8DPN2_9NOCA